MFPLGNHKEIILDTPFPTSAAPCEKPVSHCPAIADACPADHSSALWNPTAANFLGLLLSPAFSAYVHMRNWRVIGDLEKTAQARTWFIALAAYFCTTGVLTVVGRMRHEALAPPAAINLLLIALWCAREGREQNRFLRTYKGGAYVRRPWTGVIVAAFGIQVALCLLVLLVAGLLMVAR